MISYSNGCWPWLLGPQLRSSLTWLSLWPGAPTQVVVPRNGLMQQQWYQWPQSKQRYRRQFQLNQREGQPFSWLLDQEFLRDFISWHLAPWIDSQSAQLVYLLYVFQAGIWGLSSALLLDYCSYFQWIIWTLGTMDIASSLPGSLGILSPVEGKRLCSDKGSVNTSNHVKRFLLCDSLVCWKCEKILHDYLFSNSDAVFKMWQISE